MSSESFTLVRASDLTKTGEGGGVPGEDIAVHRIPLGEVAAFVAAKRRAGYGVDAKMLLLLGAGIVTEA